MIGSVDLWAVLTAASLMPRPLKTCMLHMDAYGYTLKSDLTKTSSWLKDEPDGAAYLVTESGQACKLGFVTSQLILMQPVCIDNLARTEQC